MTPNRPSEYCTGHRHVQALGAASSWNGNALQTGHELRIETKAVTFTAKQEKIFVQELVGGMHGISAYNSGDYAVDRFMHHRFKIRHDANRHSKA